MACPDGPSLYLVEFAIWQPDGHNWHAILVEAREFQSPDKTQYALGDLTSASVQNAWESKAATVKKRAWDCPDTLSLDKPIWTKECPESSVGINYLEYIYCSVA